MSQLLHLFILFVVCNFRVSCHVCWVNESCTHRHSLICWMMCSLFDDVSTAWRCVHCLMCLLFDVFTVWWSIFCLMMCSKFDDVFTVWGCLLCLVTCSLFGDVFFVWWHVHCLMMCSLFSDVFFVWWWCPICLMMCLLFDVFTVWWCVLSHLALKAQWAVFATLNEVQGHPNIVTWMMSSLRNVSCWTIAMSYWVWVNVHRNISNYTPAKCCYIGCPCKQLRKNKFDNKNLFLSRWQGAVSKVWSDGDAWLINVTCTHYHYYSWPRRSRKKKAPKQAASAPNGNIPTLSMKTNMMV